MEMLVYFDSDTGRIVAITNELRSDDEYAVITVDFKLVENLLIGSEIFDQYRVLLNETSKEYQLEKVNSVDLRSLTDSVFKIPLVKKPANTDLIVVQDRQNEKWIIKLNEAVYQSLLATQISNLDKPTNLYITDLNDPNVLHDTLTFSISQFNNSRQIEFDLFDITLPVSIYCRKYFTSYAHIIK